MSRKPFSKDYQPGKRRGKNKPRPFIQRLREAFGEHISDKDMKDLVERALTHAKGDTIITESLDGEKLTAKCVSDPRLLLGMGKMVTDAETKKPDTPPTPADSVKAAIAVLKELEELSKPLDPKPAT